MSKTVEAATVTLSVLYLGFVIHALSVFFMNDGLAKIRAKSQAAQQERDTTPVAAAPRPYAYGWHYPAYPAAVPYQAYGRY